MKKKILNVLFALVLVLSFTLVVGTPAAADPGTYYVATSGNDSASGEATTPWLTIQHAIDFASANDTINVAAGTYVEDLSIVGKDGLQLVGATGATIKGITTTPRAGFPAGLFNIKVWSNSVKIHGFTIQSPDPVSDNWSSGVVICGTNIEIYNNAFEVANSDNVSDTAFCVGIQTNNKADAGDIPGGVVDVSGLNIHDNTFTHLGTGTVGYEGIYINPDTGSGTVTIADNTFTGYLARGVTTERSNTTISGNSLITDVATSVTTTRGIRLISWAEPPDDQDTVTITGNTIKGSAAGKGFAQGIWLGYGVQTLTNITVTQNTVQLNATGIYVVSSADGVVVNYNNINGNTTYGVENADGVNTLDAENNWWGAASGPTHASNPTGTGDAVTGNIDFVPWLDAAYPAGEPSGYPVYNVTQGQGYETITEAVDAADPGDTITVAAGEYEESFIYINKSLTLLGAGADVTEIYVNGADYGISVYLGYDEDNLDEPLAETVVIDGFAIDNAEYYLIWLEEVNNGSSVTVSNCILYNTDYGIYCGGATLDNDSTVNIIGNLIYDINEYDGIYIAEVTGGSALNIIDNYVCENNYGYGVYIDQVSEDSTVTIAGNTIGGWADEYDNYAGNYDGGIHFNDVYDSTVTIGGDTAAEGNTINRNARGDGIYINYAENSIFTIEGNQICENGWESSWGRDGIEFSEVYDGNSITILNNDILENYDCGIQLFSEGVGEGNTVAINYNSIVGNGSYSGGWYGIRVDTMGVTVDATCNWWGNVAGPWHEGDYANPYQQLTPTGDRILGDVIYSPWMIQSQLAEGWNIWSRPIVPDEDSWEQMQNELVEAGIESIYYFDSATQLWGLDPDAAGPLDAFYIKMADDSRIRYYFSAEPTWPPLKAMKVGWNFIGLNQLYEMDTPIALLDIYFGTGGAFVPGYSKVICPSLNGASWTYLPDGDGGGAYMYPIKGYWVFMVNNGVLGGFITTPIVEIENT